ncbi:MAG: hypothetical protein EOP11_02830 [Proteobacteria bacterium]|nr:MAG: hypothetical protein EOP11_02830 [Pseudomonadota bacterium]
MARIPLYAALLLSVALSSCGSPVSTAKNSTPGYDAANPTGGDPTNGIVNDNAGFFLKVSSDTATTLVTHRSSGDYKASTIQPTDNFSKECRVMPTASPYTEKDILCIAEIEELDLYFSELKVQYHVPRNMCHYLRHEPYVFWALTPGTGETAVNWVVGADGKPADGLNSKKGVPICKYDYTKSGGPNCCVGNFTQTVTVMKSGGGSDVNVSDEKWGGDVSQCLFGPGMESQTKGSSGFPKPDIFYVNQVGLNSTYTIKPAIDQSYGEKPVLSNLWAANFYNQQDHPVASASIPGTPPFYVARRPIPTRWALNYTQYLPSDTYDFSCLDRAEEVKFRIRLMIREWNESPVVEGGNPDVDVPNVDDPSLSLNDRLDWKDTQDFHDTPPAPTNPPTPVSYYPGENYL